MISMAELQKENAELKEKLHRRNMQIENLRKSAQEGITIGWLTVSDLFFNSIEAGHIEFTDGWNGNETMNSVKAAVQEWCANYPGIGKNIDQMDLVRDYMKRV